MGRVTHFEIHATDPARSIRFYKELFGWTFDAWGPPGTYWLITTGDAKEPGINGGLVPRRGAKATDGQPVNAFVCTAEVKSAKESLARAIALGGTEAVALMPIPGMGWLGYVKDPDGNLLGMMQPDPTAK